MWVAYIHLKWLENLLEISYPASAYLIGSCIRLKQCTPKICAGQLYTSCVYHNATMLAPKCWYLVSISFSLRPEGVLLEFTSRNLVCYKHLHSVLLTIWTYVNHSYTTEREVFTIVFNIYFDQKASFSLTGHTQRILPVAYLSLRFKK